MAAENPIDADTEALPSRATLAEWSPRRIHHASSPVQCDIWLLNRNGREAILKDGARQWWIFRALLVRRSQRSEYRFL